MHANNKEGWASVSLRHMAKLKCTFHYIYCSIATDDYNNHNHIHHHRDTHHHRSFAAAAAAVHVASFFGFGGGNRRDIKATFLGSKGAESIWQPLKNAKSRPHAQFRRYIGECEWWEFRCQDNCNWGKNSVVVDRGGRNTRLSLKIHFL